eukprot:jgi/Chrzof1/11416/Cz05g35260.t1
MGTLSGSVSPDALCANRHTLQTSGLLRYLVHRPSLASPPSGSLMVTSSPVGLELTVRKSKRTPVQVTTHVAKGQTRRKCGLTAFLLVSAHDLVRVPYHPQLKLESLTGHAWKVTKGHRQ